MIVWRFRASAAAVLVLTALLGVNLLVGPALAANAAPAGGVRGIVKQPLTGMCPVGDPCDGIGRGILLVFTRAGQVPHRTRSDTDGRFSLRLAPGRYRVRAVVAGAVTQPTAVVVPRQGFARLTVTVAAATVP